MTVSVPAILGYIPLGLLITIWVPTSSETVSDYVAFEESCQVSPAVEHGGRRRSALLQAVKSVKAVSKDAGQGVMQHNAQHKLKHLRDIQLGPRDPDWFGGFSIHESTFDPDGIRRRTTYIDPLYNDQSELDDGPPRAGLPYKWFQESRSGGPQQAWQTFYPAMEDHRPRGNANPPWRAHTSGHGSGHDGAEQEFEPEGIGYHVGRSLEKPPGWFETVVTQYDAFGRGRAPSEDSDHSYEGWTKKTTEGTLTCERPGCQASVRLTVFDHQSQRHARCRLYVHVHPTDFDDEYSKEHLEWITLNGHMVNHKCDPMVSGCHDNHKHLYPCVNGRDIDSIIGDDGKLEVSAKLSPMVDECPVDGNLLSGTVSVTCFILPRLRPVEPLMHVNQRFQAGTAALRCHKPGCSDTNTVFLLPHEGPCYLKIVMDQTDFDNDHGSTEELEWLMVNKHTIKTNVKPDPRRNPCKDGLGVPEPFALLPGQGEPPFDVTEEAARGAIEISAKISDMVDECGIDGRYLLNANATVECSAPSIAQTQWPSSAATEWVPMPSGEDVTAPKPSPPGEWEPAPSNSPPLAPNVPAELAPAPSKSGSDEPAPSPSEQESGDPAPSPSESEAGDDGWEPSPSKSGSDGWVPAPSKSGDDGWVPAPSKSGDDGSVPTPSKSGDDGWEPAPAKSGDDGWVPAPSKSGDDGWVPTPSTSGDDGWVPAPSKSHSEETGSSGDWVPSPAKSDSEETESSSGEGEWVPAPSAR